MFYEVFFYSCCLNFIDFSFVPPSRLSLSLIACAFLSASPDTERKVFFSHFLRRISFWFNSPSSISLSWHRNKHASGWRKKKQHQEQNCSWRRLADVEMQCVEWGFDRECRKPLCRPKRKPISVEIKFLRAASVLDFFSLQYWATTDDNSILMNNSRVLQLRMGGSKDNGYHRQTQLFFCYCEIEVLGRQQEAFSDGAVQMLINLFCLGFSEASTGLRVNELFGL